MMSQKTSTATTAARPMAISAPVERLWPFTFWTCGEATCVDAPVFESTTLKPPSPTSET
jgi:hypothetical protein